MELDDTFSLANPRVAAKILDGELIVINLSTGYYFSSTGTGVAIWQEIEAGASLRQVVDSLVRRYEVAPQQAECDARAFLDKLMSEALLEPATAARSLGTHASESAAERLPYEPPELLKFDDMAAQFAVDPPLMIKSRA